MQTTTQKLEKTRKSIGNHIMRGGSFLCYRSQELIWRYDDLKDKAIESGEWKEYCQNIGADNNHDGHDLFA